MEMSKHESHEEMDKEEEFMSAMSDTMRIKPVGDENDLEQQVVKQAITKEVENQLEEMFGDSTKPKFKVETLI